MKKILVLIAIACLVGCSSMNIETVKNSKDSEPREVASKKVNKLTIDPKIFCKVLKVNDSTIFEEGLDDGGPDTNEYDIIRSEFEKGFVQEIAIGMSIHSYKDNTEFAFENSENFFTTAFLYGDDLIRIVIDKQLTKHRGQFKHKGKLIFDGKLKSSKQVKNLVVAEMICK